MLRGAYCWPVRAGGGGHRRVPGQRVLPAGQLPQQALAASVGDWTFSPPTEALATSEVPVLKKDSPLLTLGLGPPRASLAIESTPREAILPGYCVASEANSPLVTNFRPAQLPSMA